MSTQIDNICVTISPKVKDDFNLVDCVKHLYECKYAFLCAQHEETGHLNYHIYIRLLDKVRTDNFRRQFLKYIVGDSIPKFALRVTNAYSLQNFINYVMHEESVKFIMQNLLSDQEIQDCIKNKVVIQSSKSKVKVLTQKNATNIIVDFCKLNQITPVDYPSTQLMITSMLDQGYDFTPLRGKIRFVMSQVKYHLTHDVTHIRCLIMEAATNESLHDVQTWTML